MLPPETLQKIRRIELRTRRIVRDSFAGAYHSIFKGKGIAFDAVRPYQPGDDIRDIDWNVTARTDEPFIKSYVEERELTVMLLVDSSASCLFGSAKRQKYDLAAELVAVFSLAAVSNNDKVGLLVFSHQIDLFIPPRKGRNHVLRVIRDMLTRSASIGGTDISLALQTANRLLKQRAIIFLISDFLAPARQYSSDLLVTGRKHDVIAVVLNDPLEKRWPGVGLVSLQDAETGAGKLVDTSYLPWQKGFANQTQRFIEARDSAITRAGVDRIDMPVNGDYVKTLMAFFQRRARVSR